MTFGKRRSLSICAVLAAGLWFSCAVDVLAQNGPQPTLRLDMTQTYGMSLAQGTNTPFFFSTTDGQLIMMRGNLGNTLDARASSDQGRTWLPWNTTTWPTMYNAGDVVRRGKHIACSLVPLVATAVSGPGSGGRTTKA